MGYNNSGIFSIFLIYTSYLLLFKKSYNLLAGITEEELKEAQNSVEKKLSMKKVPKL